MEVLWAWEQWQLRQLAELAGHECPKIFVLQLLLCLEFSSFCTWYVVLNLWLVKDHMEVLWASEQLQLRQLVELAGGTPDTNFGKCWC